MLSLLALISAMQAAPTPAQISRIVAAAPAIRSRFDAHLLDYPSARFRDVRATVGTGDKAPESAYLCGYVNARNRMGGYIGWRAFMATEDDLLIEGEAVADIVIPRSCGAASASDMVDRTALLAHR